MIPEELLEIIVDCLLLLPFLLLSAFFSGTETAFFTLNSLERENLKLVTSTRWQKFLHRLLAQPDHLLVTILTGNMFVNVFATDFFASNITEKLSRIFPLPDITFFSLFSAGDLFSIVIMTLLILIFGEMTPKNLAVRHPVAFARFSVLPLFLSDQILRPFTFFMKKLQASLMRRVPSQSEADEDLKNELLSLTVRVGYGKKLLNKFELELFESYIDFRNKTAADVMIPRTRLWGVDISTPVSSLLERLASPGGSEITHLYVYRRDIDHIIGFVHVRDLLPFRYGKEPPGNLEKIVKPFYSVPESKCLADLSAEMSEENLPVVHVVDEYGGTAGIISFQHLIEDIFDHFYASPDKIQRTADGWFQIHGTLDLQEIEKWLDMEFESDARTVAGMIIEYIEDIPVSGALLTIQGVDFKITRASQNRILALEFKKQ